MTALPSTLWVERPGGDGQCTASLVPGMQRPMWLVAEKGRGRGVYLEVAIERRCAGAGMEPSRSGFWVWS